MKKFLLVALLASVVPAGALLASGCCQDRCEKSCSKRKKSRSCGKKRKSCCQKDCGGCSFCCD